MLALFSYRYSTRLIRVCQPWITFWLLTPPPPCYTIQVLNKEEQIKRLLLVTLSVLIFSIFSILSVSASVPVIKCPTATSEGAYFERGIGKDGNVICGFSWYNACPYTEAVSANDPGCEKLTEEQLKPWQPTVPAPEPATEPELSEWGGK